MTRAVSVAVRMTWTTVLLMGFLSLAVVAAARADQPPAVDLSPGTGSSGTKFAFRFGSKLACPGDAESGYRWQTFIVSESVDPTSLVYSYAAPRSTTGFASYLRTSTERWIREQLPALQDGQVLPPTDVSFAGGAFESLVPGHYQIGVACTRPDASGAARTRRVWSVGVTVESRAGAGPNNFIITSDEFTGGPQASGPTATAVSPTSQGAPPSTAVPDSLADTEFETAADGKNDSRPRDSGVPDASTTEPTTGISVPPSHGRSAHPVWWIAAVLLALIIGVLTGRFVQRSRRTKQR